MRLALFASKSDPAGSLNVQLATLPDPVGFPVLVRFDASNRFESIAVAEHPVSPVSSAVVSASLESAAAILDNLSHLFAEGVITCATTAHEFATAIEERQGRQVVVGAGGRLVSVSRIKEKSKEKTSTIWNPVVNGKVVVDVEVDAATEKEAASKLRLRFVNAASEDKGLALLIGPWLADGMTVKASGDAVKLDFINLHDFK